MTRQLARYFIGWFVVLYGVWLVLVDSLAHPEVGFGPLAAILGALLAVAVQCANGERFQFRPKWLVHLRGVPEGVLRDCALLGVALWRRVVRHERSAGRFLQVPVLAGGPDPEGAAWRALVTIVASTAPNHFVVGIDRERGVVLVHQLVPVEPTQLRDSIPGATAT